MRQVWAAPTLRNRILKVLSGRFHPMWRALKALGVWGAQCWVVRSNQIFSSFSTKWTSQILSKTRNKGFCSNSKSTSKYSNYKSNSYKCNSNNNHCLSIWQMLSWMSYYTLSILCNNKTTNSNWCLQLRDCCSLTENRVSTLVWHPSPTEAIALIVSFS